RKTTATDQIGGAPEREPSGARSTSDWIGRVESIRTFFSVGGRCEPRTARAPFLSGHPAVRWQYWDAPGLKVRAPARSSFLRRRPGGLANDQIFRDQNRLR